MPGADVDPPCSRTSDAAGLLAAPVTTVVQILQKDIPVSHSVHLPAGCAWHRCSRQPDVPDPSRVGGIAMSWSALHVLHVVLLRGVAAGWRTLRLMLLWQRRLCGGTNRSRTADREGQRSNENR
jgi:hypothetical protein